MMKTKTLIAKRSVLVLYVMLFTNFVGILHSQIPPSIISPPGSQTNLAGTMASFSVAVSGSGPFTYQWQFNGTNLPNDVTTTVAGTGGAGYSGDQGPAISATLNEPTGLAFDQAGNLLIADWVNNRVRRVDVNGTITTFAGNGNPSFSGDGGAATNASLNRPTRVALDAAGNLYLSDQANNRIRKVTTNGIISTIAGNGTATYHGDGSAATNASLNFPCGLAFDNSGNLYLADEQNNRIREVATNGIITTVAGITVFPGFVGDGGPATAARLSFPDGVLCDGSGNLYIGDTLNNRVRKVDAGGIITTVAGTGAAGYTADAVVATNSRLNEPQGLAFDAAGRLYISDLSNSRIRLLATNGLIFTAAGNGIAAYGGDGAAATNASINFASSTAFDAAGNLFIADNRNNRVRAVWYANHPTLEIGTVASANAGDYTVVISDPFGSITSAVASLTVIIPTNPPSIIANGTRFGFVTNQFGFGVTGAFGQTIIIDGSTNLINWRPIFTNATTSSPFYFTDPVSTNLSDRFYRARLP